MCRLLICMQTGVVEPNVMMIPSSISGQQELLQKRRNHFAYIDLEYIINGTHTLTSETPTATSTIHYAQMLISVHANNRLHIY